MTHQARLAAMGEMLANIAHQWRQPLNHLSMLLANMRDGWRQAEPDRERLEQDFSNGQEQIQKMSSTISDFMNFFRPEKEMSTFSCLHQVRAVLALVETSFRSARVEIQLEAEGDVLLGGFPNEYSHVLLNLLSNAKQAIKAASTKGGQIRIHLSAVDGFGQLTVSDTGGGIPDHLLERVFEPYFSTKASGTGIGLYMSRQIIEHSMKGQLAVRNITGGAEFLVRVPISKEA